MDKLAKLAMFRIGDRVTLRADIGSLENLPRTWVVDAIDRPIGSNATYVYYASLRLISTKDLVLISRRERQNGS